ncbi:rRNA processing/ribosome biogenesis-domain-containing protein [Chiua virens]|nr:rRNA processing/ribosome biogenesis-domain-containing protein [Chiua virens]
MDVPHQLETLLHFLVTDASSVAHLPYLLDHLSPACLSPSPHLQKWVTRLTSLMHSKDTAARWAAICIAYRMSFLSKSLLVDNAQSWVGIVFPCLSKPEPIPILRVSMRYLNLVLCAAEHNLEFQRQVAIPMVPKVSLALLTIAEKHNDRDIKTSSIRMLAQLIPLYPSLHKALGQRLSALCHQIFSGSVRATDTLVDATANLYSVLHFLGGKVGGTDLWRNCLDEALQMSWSAWLGLRTTFPTSAQMSHNVIAHLRTPDGKLPDLISYGDATREPLTRITLNLNRLKCGVSAISALLRAPVTRPVKVPFGHLSAFGSCLLASTLDDEGQTYFDPHVRVAESSVVPAIWNQACRLLSCLAQTAQDLLAQHKSRLITIISSQLDNSLEQAQKHSFLQCAYHLLYFCPVVDTTLGINRLLKATIPIISPLYVHQPRSESSLKTAKQSKASNKRRREYEADNVLSTTNNTICATTDDCNTLLAALDVISQCMLSTELVPSTRSLANRVLLSILLSLPSILPSSLSSDVSFHGRVIKRVRDICIETVQGSSHAMSKGSGLVLRSFLSENLATRDKLHSHVDLLLHPRRPPFVRTLPFVESLSLSSAEESTQEAATRHSLELAFGNGEIDSDTSKLPYQPEPVTQNTLAPDQQAPPNPPRGQALLTSVELQSQTTSNVARTGNHPAEEVTSSVLPMVVAPLPFASNVPTGLSLSLSQKDPAPSSRVAPMLVDESDQEELPAIDLGSDSDA